MCLFISSTTTIHSYIELATVWSLTVQLCKFISNEFQFFSLFNRLILFFIMRYTYICAPAFSTKVSFCNGFFYQVTTVGCNKFLSPIESAACKKYVVRYTEKRFCYKKSGSVTTSQSTYDTINAFHDPNIYIWLRNDFELIVDFKVEKFEIAIRNYGKMGAIFCFP